MKKKFSFLICSILWVLLVSGCQQNLTKPDYDKNTKNTVDYTPEEVAQEESDEKLAVTFIDVGQGDAILIKQGQEACMIDTGLYYEYDSVKEELQRQDIYTLKYLFLTHPDADHIGSADLIIENFDVKNVVMPNVKSDSKTYSYLEKAIGTYAVPVIYPETGNTYEIGESSIMCVAPKKITDNKNADSLILKLTYDNTGFLFLGDAPGQETDQVTDDISADVVKLAHHGSAQDEANSYELLQKIHPEYAVVSCGKKICTGIHIKKPWIFFRTCKLNYIEPICKEALLHILMEIQSHGIKKCVQIIAAENSEHRGEIFLSFSVILDCIKY